MFNKFKITINMLILFKINNLNYAYNKIVKFLQTLKLVLEFNKHVNFKILNGIMNL